MRGGQGGGGGVKADVRIKSTCRSRKTMNLVPIIIVSLFRERICIRNVSLPSLLRPNSLQRDTTDAEMKAPCAESPEL